MQNPSKKLVKLVSSTDAKVEFIYSNAKQLHDTGRFAQRYSNTN